MIHSGVYYKPGSLKARLCVQGARLMYEFCDEHGIGYERCGKLIVALREDELPRLADLETRGHANGVPGLRRVGAAEIQSIEPGCRGVAALHSPATGIVDFGAVARALEKELRGQGVDFALSTAVTGVRRERQPDRAGPLPRPLPGGLGHPVRRAVVGPAGGVGGAPADPRIIPFRGAYLRIADGQEPVVRGLVYPVPDPALPFLGVHVTRHIDGHTLLGPTALLAPARDAYRLSTVRPGDLPAR